MGGGPEQFLGASPRMNVTLRRDGTRRGRKTLTAKKKVFKSLFVATDTGTRQSLDFTVISMRRLQNLMRNVPKMHDDYMWL